MIKWVPDVTERSGKSESEREGRVHVKTKVDYLTHTGSPDVECLIFLLDTKLRFGHDMESECKLV